MAPDTSLRWKGAGALSVAEREGLRHGGGGSSRVRQHMRRRSRRGTGVMVMRVVVMAVVAIVCCGLVTVIRCKGTSGRR